MSKLKYKKVMDYEGAAPRYVIECKEDEHFYFDYAYTLKGYSLYFNKILIYSYSHAIKNIDEVYAIQPQLYDILIRNLDAIYFGYGSIFIDKKNLENCILKQMVRDE